MFFFAGRRRFFPGSGWREMHQRSEMLVMPFILFTHVQSCSSTAPIFVETVRSFPFFLIVSTLAAILLVGVALGCRSVCVGVVRRSMPRRRGSLGHNRGKGKADGNAKNFIGR